MRCLFFHKYPNPDTSALVPKARCLVHCWLISVSHASEVFTGITIIDIVVCQVVRIWPIYAWYWSIWSTDISVVLYSFPQWPIPILCRYTNCVSAVLFRFIYTGSTSVYIACMINTISPACSSLPKAYINSNSQLHAYISISIVRCRPISTNSLLQAYIDSHSQLHSYIDSNSQL